MTYVYDNSIKTMIRASKVVPNGVYGHLGPAEGCMIPASAFPFFVSKAKGSEMWDVDGNRFIDYMCGYGPNILGYGDPDVNAAVAAQMKKADCTTLCPDIMVEFAELLTDTVKKDWAFFCKNGGDTTTLAVMVARFFTGKSKIVFVDGYYHGVAPWTQRPDSPGTLEDDCKNRYQVRWNDVEQVRDLFANHGNEIACFISTPYMHGNFTDNQLPKPGYWKEIRELCTKYGVILIMDDIRCGFRLSTNGSDDYFGIQADLVTFCKAIANGFALSALCGKDFLKSAIASIPYTGSYWLQGVPFAAGIATLNKLKSTDSCAHMKEMGERLNAGIAKTAKELKVPLVISGAPALFYWRIDDELGNFLLHQEWIAECVKRGVFVTNHHNHFTNMSSTAELIDESIEICSEAMQIMVKNHPEIFR